LAIRQEKEIECFKTGVAKGGKAPSLAKKKAQNALKRAAAYAAYN